MHYALEVRHSFRSNEAPCEQLEPAGLLHLEPATAPCLWRPSPARSFNGAPGFDRRVGNPSTEIIDALVGAAGTKIEERVA